MLHVAQELRSADPTQETRGRSFRSSDSHSTTRFHLYIARAGHIDQVGSAFHDQHGSLEKVILCSTCALLVGSSSRTLVRVSDENARFL